MKTRITRSIDWQHLYIYDSARDIVTSYQLVKRLNHRHYFYILSHTFNHYIQGIFGIEVMLLSKIELLDHHLVYVDKLKRIS